MNKLTSKYAYPVAMAISLPLLMLGGCASNESVKLTPDTAIAENEISEPIDVINEQQVDLEGSSIGTEDDKKIEVIEPVEVVETETMLAEISIPKPQKDIIGFGFDKSDIDAEYGELLWQHAQYLKENKNLVLHINGHTDNSGARVYNEMLSKKRADQVANILGEFGAPLDRIKVMGYAGDQPLAGAVHHKEHRRVELDYQDQQIVSN